jgi:Uma2 family endonuclease
MRGAAVNRELCHYHSRIGIIIGTMSTIRIPSSEPSRSPIPELEAGDRLDQKTFHQRYLAMPPHVRAELIGGVVYMPSPLKATHADIHGELMCWLKLYKSATPGVRVLDNATDKLGDESEPQPDASLMLIGGQTRVDDDDYLTGPPELVAEVASSSESIDMHAKKRDYERYGAREYVVFIVRNATVRWFIRDGEMFKDLPADSDGIFRSPFLPGLWLDSAALLRGDTKRVQEVLNLGLATPEHAAFAAARSQK